MRRHGQLHSVGGGTVLTPYSSVSLAMRWDGGRWRVVRTGLSDTLPSVSCVRMSRCLAVGGYVDRSDNTQALGEASNGRTWRLASPPGLGDLLNTVSCASQSFCVAVGGPAAATWNGARWTSVNANAISGGGFAWLSCTSRTFCIALGGPGGSQVWNGRSWRSAVTVAPAGSTGFDLSDVSCTSPAFCMAVGGYSTDEYGEVNSTLAEVWRGTRWRVLPSPDLGKNNVFTSVSCVIRAGCMAVGSNIAALWNGTAWRALPMPRPGVSRAAIGGLVDVSCPSAASCMAVGGYYDPGNGLGYGVAVVWNGKTWRLTTTAGPGSRLFDVSCAAPRMCVAVGEAGNLTRAERWNGTTWNRLKTPNP